MSENDGSQEENQDSSSPAEAGTPNSYSVSPVFIMLYALYVLTGITTWACTSFEVESWWLRNVFYVTVVVSLICVLLRALYKYIVSEPEPIRPLTEDEITVGMFNAQRNAKHSAEGGCLKAIATLLLFVCIYGSMYLVMVAITTDDKSKRYWCIAIAVCAISFVVLLISIFGEKSKSSGGTFNSNYGRYYPDSDGGDGDGDGG